MGIIHGIDSINMVLFHFILSNISHSNVKGHEEVVRILLESGAEVNSRDKDLNTPLHAVIIINISILLLF